jgi:hypothetical protein
MLLSDLPAEIRTALAPLTPALTAGHLSPVSWTFSEKAFGNFVVTFRGPGHALTLTRDRGQLIVDGCGRKSLKGAGLRKAFDTAEDLLPHLSNWLGQ